MTDWWMALLGGGFIGVAATMLLLTNGRVMGVSGIISGVITPAAGEWLWRVALLIGLLLGGVIASSQLAEPFVNETGRSTGVILIAGLLVGYGTRLGSGCTSGHGVCGISRFSKRSILATITFILAGMITVRLFSLLAGGGL